MEKAFDFLAKQPRSASNFEGLFYSEWITFLRCLILLLMARFFGSEVG